MSFSFCLNKAELLISCGCGLLFHGIDLNRRGKLIQDSRRLVSEVLEKLEQNPAPSAARFKAIATAWLTTEQSPKTPGLPTLETASQKISERCMPAPRALTKSTQKPLQAIACRLPPGSGYGAMSTGKAHPVTRTASEFTNHGPYAGTNCQNSIPSALSEATAQHRYPEAVNYFASPCRMEPSDAPTLDYLSFNNNSYSTIPLRHGLPEKLLIKHDPESSTGYGQTRQPPHPYDVHGPSDSFSAYVSPSPSSGTHDCLPDMWKLHSDPNHNPVPPPSVASFSEDEGTNGEELINCHLGGKIGRVMMTGLNGFATPHRFGF
jgi:hypothetical protein